MLWKWGRESTWVREEKEASQRQRSVFAVETEWGGLRNGLGKEERNAR